MTVEAPSHPTETQSSTPQSQPNALRNLMLAGIMVLIAMLFIGWPGAPGANGGRGLPGPVTIPANSVTVFFSKYQGSESITEYVVRRIPADQRDNPLRFAITELLAGPTAEEKRQGFYSEIPAGTELLDITEQSGTVRINLSSQFTEGGGSNTMEQRFEQIRDTAYSVESSQTLSIAVEGEELVTLGGEGLEVQESLKRGVQ